jgi:hypothetical protein
VSRADHLQLQLLLSVTGSSPRKLFFNSAKPHFKGVGRFPIDTNSATASGQFHAQAPD